MAFAAGPFQVNQKPAATVIAILQHPGLTGGKTAPFSRKRPPKGEHHRNPRQPLVSNGVNDTLWGEAVKSRTTGPGQIFMEVYCVFAILASSRPFERTTDAHDAHLWAYRKAHAHNEAGGLCGN